MGIPPQRWFPEQKQASASAKHHLAGHDTSLFSILPQNKKGKMSGANEKFFAKSARQALDTIP
jgi:hypothetical protein